MNNFVEFLKLQQNQEPNSGIRQIKQSNSKRFLLNQLNTDAHEIRNQKQISKNIAQNIQEIHDDVISKRQAKSQQQHIHPLSLINKNAIQEAQKILSTLNKNIKFPMIFNDKNIQTNACPHNLSKKLNTSSLIDLGVSNNQFSSIGTQSNFKRQIQLNSTPQQQSQQQQQQQQYQQQYQQKIIQEIFKDKQKSKKLNKRKSITIDKVEYHGQLFTQKLQNDPITSLKCGKQMNYDIFNKIFTSFYECGRGKKPLLNEDKLGIIHQHLSLGHQDFNKMKQFLIEELYGTDLEDEQFFHGVWKFEGMRVAVLNKRGALEQFGDLIGIQKFVNAFYNICADDFILQQVLQQYDMGVLIQNFVRYVIQILKHNETPVNHSIMFKQQKYDMTYIHYSQFKYKFIQTLNLLKIPQKLISYLIETIGLQKNTMLNYDSLEQIINQFGVKEFVDELIMSSQGVALLENFTINKGRDQLRQFFQILIKYFSSYYRLGVGADSLKYIYNKLFNIEINPKISQILKTIFFNQLNKLNPHPIVSQDLEEEWDDTMNRACQRPLIYQQLGGWKIHQLLVDQVVDQSKNDTYLIRTHQENSCDTPLLLKRELTFLCSNRQLMKKNELKCIHQRLFITDQVYDMYSKNIFQGLENIDRSDLIQEMRSVLEMYRTTIVSD